MPAPDKEISFGMCENLFTTFPQDGYADEMGTLPGDRRYKCAVSAACAHVIIRPEFENPVIARV